MVIKVNSKERVTAALCLEEPDKVPNCEFLLTDPNIRSIVLKRDSTGHFMTLFKGADDAYTRHLKSLEEQVFLMKELKMDMVSFSDAGCVPKGFRYKVLPDYRDKKVVQDFMGRIYVQGSDGQRWYKDGIIKQPEDFEDFEFMDLDAPGKFDVIEKAVEMVGDEMFILGTVHWGFGYAWEIVGGLEKLLLLFHTNPVFVKKLLYSFNDYMVEVAKKMIDLGVDGILTRDDLAGERGSFISPKIFDEFLLPIIKNLAKAVKSRGAFLLMHSDGDMYEIINNLLNSGVELDCFNPIEPELMSLKTCKERYGDRMALWGNVSCASTLVRGTVEDTRKEVIKCIEDAAPGGGYILSSSNSIYPGCKYENVITMIETKEKYGRYPIII